MKILHRHFLVLSGLMALAGCASTLPDETPEQVLVPLFYVTDRATDTADDPPSIYGSERGQVQFGRAKVALSPRKEGESPFADWSRWEPRANGSRHRNELATLSPLDPASFDAELRTAMPVEHGRSVFLYVHGFRRDFDVAAIDLASVVYEADLQSLPVLFSWPSGTSVLGYAGDASSVRWATNDLRDTIRHLLELPDVDTLHLAAHSLGNVGLLEALVRLSRDPDARLDKIGEIVLASPDVDTGLFQREYMDPLRSIGARVTLYVTENDVPLQASQRVNRHERLGDASTEIFIGDGIETVVFSDVVTFMNSHDAIVEIGNVQADIHYLLEERLGASERPSLEAVDTEDGRYWRLRDSQTCRNPAAGLDNCSH
ncbi:MAG: alpha/beta hydrolase [Woeseiaceae bacterium]|nr:alpha/beta hydrolase [Woeseiaceae bacterium]